MACISRPQRQGAAPGTATRIPTPAGWAALQGVPLGAGQTAASRSAVLGKLSFIPDIHAQNVVFRNLSTQLVNGVPIETGLMSVSYSSPSTYHYVLGRVDHRFSNSDNMTFRYYYNKREDLNITSNCNFGELFCANQDLLDTNLAASESHIFTSRMLNEFRFSLVRRDLTFPENEAAATQPTAIISGLFTIGGASNFPQSRVTNAYQFSDTVTWSLERHTMKFGGDVRYNDVNNEAAFDSKGTFNFNSLQDYMNNMAFSFAQAQQTSSFKAKQWQTFWFVQDDFRLKPNFTINMGLRYELSNVPFGLFGAEDQQSLNALVPGPVEIDKNNWSPRVGFAWTPSSTNPLIGDGRTVFRGGYGKGYDVLFFNLWIVNASNFPRVNVPLQNNVQNVYPNLLPVSGTPTFNPLNTWVNSAPDTQNPESQFYSFTMQRELATNYLVEVGYTGSRGSNGINQMQANPAILTDAQIATVQATGNPASIPGIQARRLNPQFGSRILIPSTVGPSGNDTNASSTYNAGFVSLTRRFADNYQFAHAHADAAELLRLRSRVEPLGLRPPAPFTASYILKIPGPKTGVWRRRSGAGRSPA